MFAAAVIATLVLAPQVPASAPGKPGATPTPPPDVAGYVATVELRAMAPLPPLAQPATLTMRAYLARDLSRQEVVASDSFLPVGTVILHQAGERAYLVVDPRAKTYTVMDGLALLDVVEGATGAVDSQFDAKVRHTDEKRVIAGYPCRRSLVTVTYVSAVRFENSFVKVQRQTEVEVWHTASLVSSAAIDHFFFKFQRDTTGAVRKALGAELGFPMQVKMVVTQGQGDKASVQAGSFHLAVTEVKKEDKLDSELFRIPPAGHRQIDRLPFAVPASRR